MIEQVCQATKAITVHILNDDLKTRELIDIEPNEAFFFLRPATSEEFRKIWDFQSDWFISIYLILYDGSLCAIINNNEEQGLKDYIEPLQNVSRE